MSPRNSVSVVGIKQSRAVLNRGLSSCSVKDNTMSSVENVGSSVRILVILFTKKSENYCIALEKTHVMDTVCQSYGTVIDPRC